MLRDQINFLWCRETKSSGPWQKIVLPTMVGSDASCDILVHPETNDRGKIALGKDGMHFFLEDGTLADHILTRWKFKRPIFSGWYVLQDLSLLALPMKRSNKSAKIISLAAVVSIGLGIFYLWPEAHNIPVPITSNSDVSLQLHSNSVIVSAASPSASKIRIALELRTRTGQEHLEIFGETPIQWLLQPNLKHCTATYCAAAFEYAGKSQATFRLVGHGDLLIRGMRVVGLARGEDKSNLLEKIQLLKRYLAEDLWDDERALVVRKEVLSVLKTFLRTEPAREADELSQILRDAQQRYNATVQDLKAVTLRQLRLRDLESSRRLLRKLLLLQQDEPFETRWIQRALRTVEDAS